MHNKNIKHTLGIFQRLNDTLPPLVPEDVVNSMSHALEHLQNDYNISLNELEDTIIVFGKKIWPYRKAFEEFLNMEEGRMAEKFFIGRLSAIEKEKYKEFKQHGGDYRDLYSGDPLHFFDADDRVNFCAAAIAVDKDLREHTKQQVLSTNRKKYEKKILEFHEILDNIQKRLNTLLTLADDEQDHPQLADDLRSQVRFFEYGLCSLGPNTIYKEVCLSEDYLNQRKETRRVLANTK